MLHPFKLGINRSFNFKNMSSFFQYPRGSFLTKDDGFLSRLARAAAGGGKAPLGPAHSRNFVFAAQEKEVVTKEVTIVKEVS